MLSCSTATVGGWSRLRELFVDPDVAATATEVTAGSIVYEQGATADEAYFIERGQVRVYQSGQNGDTRLVGILGPGEWFGCSAFVPEASHGTRAVAVTAVTLLRAPGRRLLEVLEQRPALAVGFVQQLAAALQAAREDASRLVFEDCSARLVQALLRFSHSAAATREADGVMLRITHQQLAQAIGVARETVSLALTEMRQKNLVRTGRNQLQFDPDALRQFIANEPRPSAVMPRATSQVA